MARFIVQVLKGAGGLGGSTHSTPLTKESYGSKLRRALAMTAKELSEEIEKQGRADIRAGGNFKSARWIQGFKAKVWFVGMNPNIHVTSAVPYFRIFEYGGTIRGKPMLWIPLSFATDAQDVLARNYPGGLFRVDRKNGGAPLLLTIKRPAKPKYFGKTSVRIPKKFHIRTIVRAVLATAQARFNRIWRMLNGGGSGSSTKRK